MFETTNQTIVYHVKSPINPTLTTSEPLSYRKRWTHAAPTRCNLPTEPRWAPVVAKSLFVDAQTRLGYKPWFKCWVYGYYTKWSIAHVLPWCWYIHLHNWVILFGQMLVNIPYIDHMGSIHGVHKATNTTDRSTIVSNTSSPNESNRLLISNRSIWVRKNECTVGTMVSPCSCLNTPSKKMLSLCTKVIDRVLIPPM
jgi:hypothetical protein